MLTLRCCYDLGFTIKGIIECICYNRTNFTEVPYRVKKCMNLLEDVTKMVSCAGIFSSNESIDEVPTPNIKFLLLPVLLGTLALKLTSGDRLEIVKTAEMYFRDFLQRCKDYNIKEDLEIPPLEDFDDINEVESSSFSTRNVDMLSMARRRASKIQQYHEQKELENRMALLKQKFNSSNRDEEIERKYFLAFINCYVNKALEDLECLISEKNLLTRVNKEKPFGAPVWDDEFEKSRKSYRSKPLQPILITRDEYQKKVFGYGYPSLPTLTVKELYEQRMRDGTWAPPGLNNPQDFSKDELKLLNPSEQEEISKENSVEDDDPENLTRSRSMDEYKDDHSRGWGNRYNRS
ncbi:hypothetical protein PGB90_001708 [Kerria lacca]